jgi:hypothetical protein
VVAEIVARELRGLDLADALELTALVALRDRERGRRFAVRWLERWVDERGPDTDELVRAAGALNALGGRAHAAALAALRMFGTG